VWEGREEPSQQAIKNLINRLRKKVSVDFIRNIYGEGVSTCFLMLEKLI
jgi:DNA-binding response OmpR family regulator